MRIMTFTGRTPYHVPCMSDLGHWLRTIAVLALLAVATVSWSANKKQTVTQVTATVELTDDVDYVVTSATPFGDEGVVNIANTDHAVLILSNVKPSAAIKLLAAHVTINGAKAVNNTNCQVKLYNLGAIILPYGNNAKPLTVFTERNFEGESTDNFGLGNSSGYMNTLTTALKNNRIRSFKLKRGYMVTFSTLPSGRGYSRCFIAADADLEVSELPAVLDQKISSYRIFKWYDAGKKNLANSAGNTAALAALNVQSTYDWGQGNSSLAPDIEWVPNHIYEDYPSSSVIGSTTQSPHTKNNNEPRNTSDDHPQDLTTILNNWENMMRTGLRLCSPASWDGSDYWNATGFLAEFLDSIDARGWRCDIIDLHCYWAEGSFGNISNWVTKYKRPVWISEWCWGASWNSNGAFASGVTEAQVKSALQSICAKLNSWQYVERYFYWNGERDPSRLYKDGSLTPAGEYYASMNSGVGYNGKYDFVPTSPRQYAPSNFSYSISDGKALISWYDSNGEYNQLMELQRKVLGGQWEVLATIEQKETASRYTYTDEEAADGTIYRLHVIDLNGTEHYSSNEVVPGDEVENSEGQKRYAGGNLIANGDFEWGMKGWTSGTGGELTQPWFQAVPTGGFGGGAYLQAYGNTALSAAGAFRTYIPIQPNTDYLFRAATCNAGTNQRLYVAADNKSSGTSVIGFQNTDDWAMQSGTFNSGENSYAHIGFSQLQAKGQIDQVELRPLFETREEAVADGIRSMAGIAQQVASYNSELPQLNVELLAATTVPATADYQYTDQELYRMTEAVHNVLLAVKAKPVIDSLLTVVKNLATFDYPARSEVESLAETASKSLEGTEAAAIVSSCRQLKEAVANAFTMTAATTQPTSPSFASETGWEVKVGTYKSGDQRTNTYGGKTCWNAWWANVGASQGTKQSMEIRQKIEKLPEGIYALECKGSTQHYCLSDQHGYLVYEQDTLVTPVLTADYMDLPAVGNIWQTLTTPPVYIGDNSTVTIGFVSTKSGATDRAWRAFGEASSTGDLREGWWCATDFQLLFHPVHCRTVEPGSWGTVCLAYAALPPAGVTLYTIAGVLSDGKSLAITPATELLPGVPYIFYSEVAEMIFFETGKATTSAKNGDNGLRGNFTSTIRVTADGYYLTPRGVWKKVSADNRPLVAHYNAFLRPFASANPAILESWDGLTMPLSPVGDVNGDSSVSVTDIVSVANYIAGSKTVSLEEADVNGDGTVSVTDIVAIANIIAAQ